MKCRAILLLILFCLSSFPAFLLANDCADQLTTMSYKFQWQGKTLELNSKGLTHIEAGELVEKEFSKEDGGSILLPVISGGIHTVEGMEKFLHHRSDIQPFWKTLPGLNISISLPSYGTRYVSYAGENGVIYFHFFQSQNAFHRKALKNTEPSELKHVRSGYGWKLLFPAETDRTTLINGIREALKNATIMGSGQGERGGFYLKGHFTMKLKSKNKKKVSIQIQMNVNSNNEIVSVFPTWDQKIGINFFHHAHAITGPPATQNGVIVFKAIRKDDSVEFQQVINELNQGFGRRWLPPQKILERPTSQLFREELGEEKKRQWVHTKQKTGLGLNATDLANYLSFLHDNPFIHVPYFERSIFFPTTDQNFINRHNVYQNTIDTLDIVWNYDREHGTYLASSAALRVLKQRIVFPYSHDIVEAKRLFNHFLRYLDFEGDGEALTKFIQGLETTVGQSAILIDSELIPWQVPDRLMAPVDFMRLDEILSVFSHYEGLNRPPAEIQKIIASMKVDSIEAYHAWYSSFYTWNEMTPTHILLMRTLSQIRRLNKPNAKALQRGEAFVNRLVKRSQNLKMGVIYRSNRGERAEGWLRSLLAFFNINKFAEGYYLMAGNHERAQVVFSDRQFILSKLLKCVPSLYRNQIELVSGRNSCPFCLFVEATGTQSFSDEEKIALTGLIAEIQDIYSKMVERGELPGLKVEYVVPSQ